MIRFRRHGRQFVLATLLPFLVLVLPVGTLAAEGEEALAAEGVPTNLGLAYLMCTEVAETAVAEVRDLVGEGTLTAVARGQHSGAPVMQSALEQAIRKGELVSSQTAAFQLNYRLLDLRIAYTGVKRAALFSGSKNVQRFGTCVLAFDLVHPDGATLYAGQTESVMQDLVPKENLPLIGSDNYSFTMPLLEEKDWSKTVEPFVVTMLVSGLVYLFFSNQSSD